MKLAQGWLLRDIAGELVAVPSGTEMRRQNRVVSLNECGAMLWKRLEQGATEEALLAAIMTEYSVERARAAQDLDAFLNTLRAASLLEEE